MNKSKRERLPLFFTHTCYREHGHDHTRVVVYECEASDLKALSEACVDNRIGYYDGPGYTGAETAARMKSHYDALIARGHTHILNTSSYDGGRVELEWLHTDRGTYCEAHVKIGDIIYNIRRNLKLFERVLKAATKRFERTGEAHDVMHSPVAFMSALNGALRAKPATLVRSSDLGFPKDKGRSTDFDWFCELATKAA